MKPIILSLSFFLESCGCTPEENSYQNLQVYIESFEVAESDVLACARDYSVPSSSIESFNTYVYYRTISDQENINFWYSDSYNNDLSLLEPTLIPNHPYEFLLMSVSNDHGLAEIGSIDFVPQ